MGKLINNKSLIEYLDIIFSRITNISDFSVWLLLSNDFDFDNATKEEKHEMLDLSSSIEKLGLTYKYFESEPHSFAHYRLTEKGIKVKEAGGHVNYHNSLTEKIKQSLKKEKTDLKLSEWKLKTFWWIFGFAFVGFGLSIYNFINNFAPQSEKIERIDEIESKIEKLQIKNFEEKEIDSLNITKFPK